ncbi:hypothetical protein [Nocardia sp. NPDC051570]|uniref:hypothetical protein n=1 Tax=Nocardia sp. NPDC051570 TaxID=3364324 RepID=UPI0037B475A6
MREHRSRRTRLPVGHADTIGDDLTADHTQAAGHLDTVSTDHSRAACTCHPGSTSTVHQRPGPTNNFASARYTGTTEACPARVDIACARHQFGPACEDRRR